MLTFAELKALAATGEVDTVVVAFTDMQGRLLGKRLHAEFFVEEMEAEHPVEGCNYLLALEMEMDPVPGYEIASWEQGYGDFGMRPDLATLRRVPWLEGTALVLGDVQWHDGSPVQPSPRQVLRAQIERAAELGLTPMMGSELEFYLLEETFAEAHANGYTGLTPTVPYILDYHILATTYDEPLLRAIRNGMQEAGMRVEASKGEAWPGQQEINFRFSDALTMADNHAIYKNGAKEIAFLHGRSISFMAKPFEGWIGNSCHIHSSLFRGDQPAFADDEVLFGRWLAGQIACAKELAVFFAPTINSYKRYAAGSWAPTTLAWGHDNRTCGYRVVGHGTARRVETRIPGGDVNPYLAFAAMIASGLHGIEQGLEAPPPLQGNAYESDSERFPSSMREAIAALEQGSMARAAFGDQVVDHYLNYARTEQGLFDRFVTDWERKRYFERI
ncbi:MAG TPA: glutamine synthetase family protein [Gaiella sp.]|uniref:glutamine synthetase family protein n=1 Tax=Gaiella sp. TaxID=2663207 RepID=UPI002D80B2C2|nr:glutamine synthetase family protein [Gaiella sp.]HET9289101.1 glutamine synthetase family protein [Gaiella sp.]